MSLFEATAASFLGAAASAAGGYAAKALFGPDDKPTATASAGPTVAPGTPYVDPLKGLENEPVPQGVGGFMGNVMVKPPRSSEEYNPYLIDGLGLLQSVMRDPPASPKMVQEIATASGVSNISSSGRRNKSLSKLFKT